MTPRKVRGLQVSCPRVSTTFGNPRISWTVFVQRCRKGILGGPFDIFVFMNRLGWEAKKVGRALSPFLSALTDLSLCFTVWVFEDNQGDPLLLIYVKARPSHCFKWLLPLTECDG